MPSKMVRLRSPLVYSGGAVIGSGLGLGFIDGSLSLSVLTLALRGTAGGAPVLGAGEADDLDFDIAGSVLAAVLVHLELSN